MLIVREPLLECKKCSLIMKESLSCYGRKRYVEWRRALCGIEKSLMWIIKPKVRENKKELVSRQTPFCLIKK